MRSLNIDKMSATNGSNEAAPAKISVNTDLPPTTVFNGTSPRSPKPCLFFAQGTCRNGNDCKFSHDLSLTTSPRNLTPAPAPLIINVPPGHPVFSIDVECVASGTQHNARSVAQVALVDEWSRPIFNVYIKQEQPVVSYIYPLTGLTKEILDQHGLPQGESNVNLSFYRVLFIFFSL